MYSPRPGSTPMSFAVPRQPFDGLDSGGSELTRNPSPHSCTNTVHGEWILAPVGGNARRAGNRRREYCDGDALRPTVRLKFHNRAHRTHRLSFSLHPSVREAFDRLRWVYWSYINSGKPASAARTRKMTASRRNDFAQRVRTPNCTAPSASLRRGQQRPSEHPPRCRRRSLLSRDVHS